MKFKRICAALLTLGILLTSACGNGKSDDYIVVNADDYSGVVTDTEKSVSSSSVKTVDVIDFSETTENSDSAMSEKTEETTAESTLDTISTSETSAPATSAPITTAAPVIATTTVTEATTAAPVVTTKVTTKETKPITTTTKAETSAPVTTESTTAKPISTTSDEFEIEADDYSVELDSFTQSTYKTLNYDEIKAVWISYIEMQYILTGKSSSEFTASIGKVFDNCVSLGINTVYIHLRPFGDAMYQSDYFPWSKYVTGILGEEPSFDPLEIMVSEAHSRGLSLQGYLNPLRTASNKEIALVTNDYTIGLWYNDSEKRDKYLVLVDGHWYLNPAYDDNINLICNGVAEILTRYDVDGIVIDDYFYPTTAISFDSDAFMDSNYSSLYDFRIDNCNHLVKSMYNTVKESNPTALFTISPAGNIDNNKNYYYADVEKWCGKKGYVDIIAPQLYFGFNNSALPFQSALESWHAMIGKSGVKLAPALSIYKIGNEDDFAGNGLTEWVTDKEIIKRQIEAIRKMSTYCGVSLYSYNYLFSSSFVNASIEAEIEAFKPLLVD